MTQPLRDRLRPGDQIRLLVYRNCDRPNQLRVQLAQLQNGLRDLRENKIPAMRYGYRLTHPTIGDVI